MTFLKKRNYNELSLPDGLLEYAQHKIKNPDENLSNFGIINTLQSCIEDLQSSLEDKKELQGICFSV